MAGRLSVLRRPLSVWLDGIFPEINRWAWIYPADIHPALDVSHLDERPTKVTHKLFPDENSGKISPETIHKRPLVKLTVHEKALAKSLRTSGKNFDEIAECLKRDVIDVEIALSTIRTRRKSPSRYTENVSEAAHFRIRELMLPNEAVWETVNCILDIH